MAGEALSELYWKAPVICTIKIPIDTNADGDIASGNDTKAGSKTFTFNYIKADATPNEVIYGSNQEGTAGVITTFIGYLLDAEVYVEDLKRTTTDIISQTAD